MKKNKELFVDFSDINLLDISGLWHSSTLYWEYDFEWLGLKLIQERIPYFECHHCGKWDYCKYTIPHRVNKHRKKDIKCWVAENALLNFVESTFNRTRYFTKQQKQDYIDGAYQLTQFVLRSEWYIGNFIDKDILGYWQDSYDLHNQIVDLRNYLDKLAKYFSKIPNFLRKVPYVFVEWDSEEVFLWTLSLSRLGWFTGYNVSNYKGKGNRKIKRLEMLLKDHLEKGYSIYMQWDADGKSSDVFQELISKGFTTQKNVFIFKYDFETSIPPKILYLYLKEKKYDLGTLEDFSEKLKSENSSVVVSLQKLWGIEFWKYKKDFARFVGFTYLDEFDDKNINNFRGSELEEFIEFLKNIRIKE